MEENETGGFTPQEATDRLADEMNVTMARMQAVGEAANVAAVARATVF